MSDKVTYLFGDDGKLVRGGVYRDMVESGQSPVCREVGGDELMEYALRKVAEEAAEIGDGDIKGELADLKEAMEYLAWLSGVSMVDVANIQEDKRRKKGDFTEGVIVRAITVTEGDEWDHYYGERPEIFIRSENPYEP